MHCITNFEAVLQQASMLLSDSPDACFVLADGHRLAEHEDLLKRHFDIEVKQDVSYNVKEACYLDLNRYEKIINALPTKRVLNKTVFNHIKTFMLEIIGLTEADQNTPDSNLQTPTYRQKFTELRHKLIDALKDNNDSSFFVYVLKKKGI